MIVNKLKPHRDEILMVNASQFFVKGRPKNELADEYVERIHQLFLGWESIEQQCTVTSTADIAANDYNLAPSRYVAGAPTDNILTLDEAVSLLRDAEVERDKADRELWNVLGELGIQ